MKYWTILVAALMLLAFLALPRAARACPS